MVTFRAIRDITRLQHGILGVIAGLTGAFIAAALDPDYIVYLTEVAYGIWIPVILIGGTMALNDYFDREVDIANKRMDRPLVRGELDPTGVLIGALIALVIGTLMTLYFSILLFISTAVFIAIATAYNARLKHYKILGNILVPFCIASPYILGALVVEPKNSEAQITILSIVLLTFCATIGREIIKDIMDYEGDTAISIPKKYGPEAASRIATVFIVISICLAPFPGLVGYEKLGQIIYFIMIPIVAYLLILSVYKILNDPTPTTASKCRKLTFIAMLIGSLAFFLGALGTNVPEWELMQ